MELFSFKRQRKLSLRFLAAFLLRIDIQQQVLVQFGTRSAHVSTSSAMCATAEFAARLPECI